MANIAVIGVGSLGVRHFQALLNCKNTLNIYIVDVSTISLNKAQEIYETEANKKNHSATYSTSIKSLPRDIDIAIIASSSNVRVQLIEELVNSKNIRYLVLEKVLFQQIEDYDRVGNLLKSKNIRTWVNCPRRMVEGYKKLRESLMDDIIEHVIVKGGSWGLGCNSIHMIDLIAYLSNNNESLQCFGNLLDDDIIESKRSGYIEFTGSLVGRLGESKRFILTSDLNSTEPVIIYIVCRSKTIIVSENKKIANIYNKEGLFMTIKIDIPFQSQLSNLFVDQILTSKDCDLTTYEESAGLHTPLIETLIKHQNKCKIGDGIRCMIT